MPGPLRHRSRPVDRRLDIGRLTQIPLRDDLRLPADPGHLPQVVVGLTLDPLPDQTRHTLGHTLSNRQDPRPTHTKPNKDQAQSTAKPYPPMINEPTARKLGLGPVQLSWP